ERETVAELIQQAEHDARLRARNAVWLGMLANRGIEPQRVREWLITWHQEADERSRISIARALALAASDDALNDLLNTVKGDRSDQVRAIAARSIARTGMFSETQ